MINAHQQVQRHLAFICLVFFGSLISVNVAFAVTCTDSYGGTTKTMTYDLPAGALNPGSNQLNSLKTDVAGAQQDLGKTFYTVMLTSFNDAHIGCANGPCENNVPGTAHRTWPLGSCVAICNVASKKCAVAKVMDRGPNTGLKCRTIDANPPLQRALGLSGGNARATYKLLSLGTGNGRGNVCGQGSDFGGMDTGPGSAVNVAQVSAPGAFANGYAPGAFGSQQPGFGSQTSSGNSTGSGGSSNPFAQPPQPPFLPQLVQQQQAQGNSQSSFTAFDSSNGGSSGSSGVATISCSNKTIRFSCDAPSTTSRGLSYPEDSAFKTRGAMLGSLNVSPTAKATYTIQCIKNQQVIDEASCSMSPNTDTDTTQAINTDMVLSIDAYPAIVKKGKRARITWSSIGATSCIITGDGISQKGKNGEMLTTALTHVGTQEYLLTCTSSRGGMITEIDSILVK